MNITYLRFHTPVAVGGVEIDRWSGLASTTDQVSRAITIDDRKSEGVILRYRAGKLAQDIEVPRGNLAQITRPAQVEGPAEKKK